jgi:hypothetical protein
MLQLCSVLNDAPYKTSNMTHIHDCKWKFTYLANTFITQHVFNHRIRFCKCMILCDHLEWPLCLSGACFLASFGSELFRLLFETGSQFILLLYQNERPLSSYLSRRKAAKLCYKYAHLFNVTFYCTFSFTVIYYFELRSYKVHVFA